MSDVTINNNYYGEAAKAASEAESVSAETALASGLAAQHIIKSSDELRLTTGLAYPAMKADVARAKDGHIDFVSKDALRTCAHKYLLHPEVSMYHQKGTEGKAQVVESYVWPDGAPDWVVGDTFIKEGDWLVTCIWNEESWPLVKAGIVNGWSPEGGAKRVTPSAE